MAPVDSLFTLRLAGRLLRNNLRLSALLLANLTAGLLGFVTLDAFNRSVATSLQAQSRALLGADLVLSSIDPFTEEQEVALRASVGAQAQVGEQIELFSMVAGPRRARLVEVHGVDRHFPLVGQFEVQGIPAPAQLLNTADKVFADPELLTQLGIRVGDPLQLGGQEFTLAGVVRGSSVRSSRGFSLAPRLYVGVKRLAETPLLQRGSRISYRRLVLLESGIDAQGPAARLRGSLQTPSIRVQTHREASQRLDQALKRLSDFLGLVAIVALFLGALGVAYLFRSFILDHVGDLAILITLGATVRRAQGLLATQLLILATTAAVGAWLLSRLLLPFIPWLLGGLLRLDVALSVPLGSLGVALAVALGGAGTLTAPQLQRLSALRPSGLFREQGVPTFGAQTGRPMQYAPALVVFWALAVWQSRSFISGSLFVAILALVAMLASAAAWTAIQRANRFDALSVRWRLALRQLRGSAVATVTAFVAIAVAATLTTVVPQLRSSLEGRIRAPGDAALPSLFLFDIQEEQEADLDAFLAERQLTLSQKSPLIRARLTQINGEPVEGMDASSPTFDTREAQTERRFRSRAYNLSYRQGLAPSETLTAGRLPAEGTDDSNPDAVAEVTLEERFASRLGLSLGDTLTFDIQGIEVRGRVVGLRQVAWESFEPNFFVQFPPHVLEPAPKVFLGTLPNMDATTREALQVDLVERFPNVSVVDVSKAVSTMRGVLDQIAWAMGLMAAVSLFAGFVLIFAIARHQARLRRREIGLLKVLGASFDDARGILDREFLLISGLATALGICVCLAAAAALSAAVLNTPWQADWASVAFTGFGIPTATLMVIRLAANAALETSPVVLLGERR